MSSASRHTRYAPGKRAWNALGLSFCFLDALGGALFLPVLPTLVGELGVVSPASNAAWVGLLVGAYYAGRSAALGAARLISSASSDTVSVASPTPSPLRVGAALALSSTVYLACGVAIGREAEAGLPLLAVLRLASGVLAAAHRALGLGCIDRAGQGGDIRESRTASAGVLGGLLAGSVAGGVLFSPGDARPALFLCIAAVIAHVPSVVALVLLLRRAGASVGDGGDWSTIGAASGYATVRGVLGGSEGEAELMRRQSWTSRDSGNGRRDAAAVAVAAAAAAEVEMGVAVVTTAAAGAGGVGANGEPASGQVGGEIEIPGRYMRGCKGDKVEAERRWRLTLEWRARERVDEVGPCCLAEARWRYDISFWK